MANITCSHCDGTGVEPRETSAYPPEPCSVCKVPVDMDKRVPHMLDPALKARQKGFVCKLCTEKHSHSSWEDTEVTIPNNGSVHLGCLIEYSQELTHTSKLAYENLELAMEIYEKNDYHNIPNNQFAIMLKSFEDALTSLKKGLHVE